MTTLALNNVGNVMGKTFEGNLMGVVFRGATAHFEYVAGQAASGIAAASLATACRRCLAR